MYSARFARFELRCRWHRETLPGLPRIPPRAAAALRHGFVHHRNRTRRPRGKTRGHQDGAALAVIDGDTSEALSIAESLHNALQVLLSAFEQKRLYRLLEAFRQETVEPLLLKG